jgi:flagellar biogenesis protein FliO
VDAFQSMLPALLVLGLLGGALYWLRTKGMARFNGKGLGGFGRQAGRQMQAIERLPLTPQHSLHLVSVNGRTLLLAVFPNGCTVLDGVALPVSAEHTVRHQ